MTEFLSEGREWNPLQAQGDISILPRDFCACWEWLEVSVSTVSLSPMGFFFFPRYYLFALVVNLSRDAYEIRVLLERAEAARKRGKSPENKPQLQAEGRIQRLRLYLQLQLQLLLQVLRDNPPLLLDLLRNACDLVIPLDKLGLCRSSPGMVGFCGLASSVLSILTILHPWLKLKP